MLNNRGEQDVHDPESPVSFVTENGSGSVEKALKSLSTDVGDLDDLS
jgi:hypothetical protein